MQSFERFYFTGSNSRLSAIDFGNPSLPDLVMVHGMRDHGLSLYSLAAALKHDYHVIAVDLCGHGRSENPGNYTMTQFVADLRALVLDRKLIKPVLVGHSLGGHIVSRYSAVFAADVPNLVLLDGIGPPGMGLAPGPEDIRQDLKAGIALVLEKPNNGRQMADEAEAVSRLSKNNPKLDLAAAQIIAQHGTEAHPDGGVRWSWDPAVRMVWQSFSKAEAEDLWQFITCPVLILTGDHSLDYWASVRPELQDQQEFYQRELDRRTRIFKNAQHRVIEGAGHMLHYDQPESVNELVKSFLG